MKLRLEAVVALAIVAACGTAFADSLEVQVGYADNIRPSPFFPSPWCGSSGVTFIGSACGSSFDAGAIRLVATTSAGFNVDSVTVTGIPAVGSGQNLWGAFQVTGLGNSAVLTQTVAYNFDTSDGQPASGNDGAMATITINFHDGTQQVFQDTGQVLNTSGSDALGVGNLNESFRWRDVGGNGTQGGDGGGGGTVTPEPSSFVLLGSGAVGLAAAVRRRFRR